MRSQEASVGASDVGGDKDKVGEAGEDEISITSKLTSVMYMLS